MNLIVIYDSPSFYACIHANEGPRIPPFFQILVCLVLIYLSRFILIPPPSGFLLPSTGGIYVGQRRKWGRRRRGENPIRSSLPNSNSPSFPPIIILIQRRVYSYPEFFWRSWSRNKKRSRSKKRRKKKGRTRKKKGKGFVREGGAHIRNATPANAPTEKTKPQPPIPDFLFFPFPFPCCDSVPFPGSVTKVCKLNPPASWKNMGRKK